MKFNWVSFLVVILISNFAVLLLLIGSNPDLIGAIIIAVNMVGVIFGFIIGLLDGENVVEDRKNDNI